jgi:hypothetical protein
MDIEIGSVVVARNIPEQEADRMSTEISRYVSDSQRSIRQRGPITAKCKPLGDALLEADCPFAMVGKDIVT